MSAPATILDMCCGSRMFWFDKSDERAIFSDIRKEGYTLRKLRRMNFGSRSEKISRRIAQMEADLKALQKENDTLTGRVDDPAVQRPLRQTRTRKPFPESSPAMKNGCCRQRHAARNVEAR